MISLSDTDVATVLSVFASRGIEASFLVPTPTGLDKSIIDATDNVRMHLKQEVPSPAGFGPLPTACPWCDPACGER